MDTYNSALSNNCSDLKKLIKVIKRRSAIFFSIPILFLAASIAVNTFTLSPIYEAKTILMVTQALETKENVVNTLAGQAKSDVLMERVIKRLDLNPEFYNPRSLSRQIKVEAVKDSNLIGITVVHRDPKQAMVIANTLGSEFKQFISEKNEELAGNTLNFYLSQIALTQAKILSATDEGSKRLLEDVLVQYGDMVRKIDMGRSSIMIISPASDPIAPSWPNKKLNMALALLTGVMVAAALAYVRESLDNTVLLSEDTVQCLDFPVMGVILHPDVVSRR